MKKSKIFIIAEIGINHNGDLNIAKKLIDIASLAGCDFVKFQKIKMKITIKSYKRINYKIENFESYYI